jgi:hypothetical protein
VETVAPFAGCENYTIGGDESDYARVEQKLRDCGLSREETLWIRPGDENKLKETFVSINYQMDIDVFRTVAKISFNYLAHEAGAKFCLLPEFDGFRRFVRYGEGNQEDFVTLGTDALLFEERQYGVRQTRGHLITVEWHPRKPAPISSVTLFNDLHYKLRFASRMSALWRELRSGHHFDLEDMTIDKLTVVSLLPARIG